MSYILDALRKADAQRVRDPARGIHAQPALDAEGLRPPGSYRTGLWATVAVGTVVVAGTALYMYQDKPAAVAQHIPAAAAVLTTAPAGLPAQPAPALAPLPEPLPAPHPAASPAPKVAVAALPPAPAMQTPARPVPTQSLALQTPSPTGPGSLRAEGDPRNTSAPTMRGGPQPGPGMDPAPAPVPAPVPQSNASVPAPAPVPVPANPVTQPPPPVPRAAPVAPAPSTTPAPLVTGLPPDAPKLAISGGVYSSNVSQRMLIVNGQVFSEGSEVGAGVVLEEIKPKSAVLKFRGTRYTVTY